MPVIQSLSVYGGPAAPGTLFTAAVGAQSAQGLALTYTWTVSTGWAIPGVNNGKSVGILAPNGYSASGTATVEVSDTNGMYAIGTIALSTEANSLPVINSVSATPNPVYRLGTVALLVSATDQDSDVLTYTWTTSNPTWIIGSGQGTSGIEITPPNTYNAGATAYVEVSDGNGGSTTGSILLSTEGNLNPVINSTSAFPNPAITGGTIALKVSATDADYDPLSITWTDANGWIPTPLTGTMITVTTPQQYGATDTVYVTVSDLIGGVTYGSILIGTVNNSVPNINNLYVQNNPAPPGATLSATVSANDSDGDALTYTWTTSANWTIRTGQGTDSITFTSPGSYQASGSVTVLVSDGNGGSVTASLPVQTIPGIPAAPVNVTATTAYDPTSVTVSWDASTGATSYKIFAGPADYINSAYTCNPLNFAFVDSTTGLSSTSQGGLPDGAVLCAAVTAVNSTGESGYSNIVVGAIAPPPIGLTAVAGYQKTTLTWSTPSASVLWYNVYITTTSGGAYTYVASPSATSFTITGLTNGVQYYFVVTAVYNDPLVNPPSQVESVYSNEATAIPTVILLQYNVGSEPEGIAIDASDNVWVTNFNGGNSPGTISRITTSGTPNTTTITVGNGPLGIAIDHSGNVWVTNNQNGLNPGTTINEVTPSGALAMTVTVAQYPQNIAIDGSGNIWVVNASNSAPPGTSISVVTTAGSLVTTVSFGSVMGGMGLAISGTGDVWATNQGAFGGSDLYEINATTYAKTGSFPTNLSYSNGIAMDMLNNLWVAPAGNGLHVKDMLDIASPSYTTGLLYALGTSYKDPVGVAVDHLGNIWVTDTYSDQVTEIDTAGDVITTITIGSGFQDDGPLGIAIDSQGNVWVTNYYNSATVTEIVGVTQGPQYFPVSGPNPPQFAGGGNW